MMAGTLGLDGNRGGAAPGSGYECTLSEGAPVSSPAEKTVAAESGSAADVDACFGHLVNVLNSGMLALMISVGDRTGLFNTMRSMPAVHIGPDRGGGGAE